MIYRPSALLFSLITIVLLLAAPMLRATDMDTVETRELASILSSVPSSTTIQGYQSSLQANGTWADVNYADTSQTNWLPLTHVNRMLDMSKAYNSPTSSLYHNATLKADILKAYDYWVTDDPQSSNWWYNQIGSPQPFSSMMLLMKNDLSAAQVTSGMVILNRSTTTGQTGANLTDQAAVKIRRGLISADNAVVSSAFSAVGSTIVITTAEGIQRDHSYHQHGAQLQSGGSYSWVYDEGITAIAPFAVGTQYAFSDTQIHTFIDYMLDGGQWFVRGQASDYTALGRAVSRSGSSNSGNGFTAHITDALTMNNGYRTAELQTWLARQNDSASHQAASLTLDFTGNKMFWESDIMIQHRPAYYASVKTSSTRTLQPESGNAEGLTNLYLADGVTQIMRTGNEYDDIMPVWNWRRLPGTTVEQDTRSLKPSADWGVAGTATYAGGVSDGVYGATGFNYNRYHVAAKKSTFFFDNEFVALGSAINASASTANVNTTLNQSLLNGTISYKTTGGSVQTMTTGSVTPTNLSWVFHDGVGYFFPTPVNNATIMAQSQSGTWYAINNTQSTSTVTKDVFTLYLDHGTAFTGGSYSYIVVPGITAATMDAYLAANPITVLNNSSSIQAIHQSTLDMTQATFYSTGTSTITPVAGQTIAVNGKSMILVRPQTNSYEVCAANAESAATSLNVTLTNVKPSGAAASWFDAMGTAVLSYGMPTGDMAGSSAVVKMASDGATNPTITLAKGNAATLTYAVNSAVALPGNASFVTETGTTLNLKNPVSGNFALTFEGGTLGLSATNTYTGLSTVHGGTVNLSGNQSAATGGWSIGPTSDNATTVNFASGSTVVVGSGKSITIGNTSSAGAASTVLNTAGTVTNNGSLSVNRAATVNLNSGAAWAQIGAISVAPPSASGFSAALTINTGASMTYTASSPILLSPSANNAGNATFTIAGGTLTTGKGFNNPSSASTTGVASVALSSGGKIVATASIPNLFSGTISPSIGTGGATIDTGSFDVGISASITGTGALTKLGTGTLTLGGTNTITALTINSGAGTVIATSADALGTGTISIPKTGTLSGKLALQTTGTNTFTNAFANFASSSSFANGGQPCIQNISGRNTLTGNMTVTGTGGNGIVVQSDAGAGNLLELAGTITTTITNRMLNLGGTGDGLVSGSINDGTGGIDFSLHKDGPGTWTLTGSNTYTNTTIANGTLQIGNGGTTGNIGSGPITDTGTLALNRSDAMEILNVIAGTGGVKQMGAGTTTLSGLNTYSGTTNVTAGTLRMTANYVPTAAAPATVSGTGTLAVTGANATFASVRGTRLSITSGATVTIASSGGSVGVSQLSGALNLDSTSRMDLVNNALILSSSATINDSPITVASLRQLLINARGNPASPTWTGPGGIGASAFDDPAAHSVGYLWKGDPDIIGDQLDTLGDITLQPSDFVVRYVNAADINLDGVVDDLDVAIIGLSYDSGQTTNNHWYDGDLTYDGKVDDQDVAILGLNYGASLPLVPQAALSTGFIAAWQTAQAAIVPEPVSVGLLSVVAGLLMRRRRAN